MKLKMKKVPELPTNRWLRATLVRIEGLDGDIDYGFGATLKFTFAVVDQEYDGVEIAMMTSAKLNNKSRLYSVLESLGIHPEEDEEVDLETLVGMPVQLKVGAANKRQFQTVAALKPNQRPDKPQAEAGTF